LPDERHDAGIAIGNEDSVKGNRPANHVDSNLSGRSRTLTHTATPRDCS
jgi:hypothetical protein